MSATAINTLCSEASTLIEAGSWAEAKVKLQAAKARLSGAADMQKGAASLRWDRAAIDSLIADCEKEITAAAVASEGVMRRQDVEYTNG